MAKANKKENIKASHKTNNDAFFVNEEEKLDLAASSSNNNEANNRPKNTLYIYKDKTTCRVVYDPYSDIYNEVYIG